MKRPVAFLLFVLVVVTAAMTVPALATPPSTDYAASETFTSTLNAADSATYHISLTGGLDFGTCNVNQTVSSQNPLNISNSGTDPFLVYISADTPPSSMGSSLAFSDSPGQDQVRWSFTGSPGMGTGTSVSDAYAAAFGSLGAGNIMTLYSNLQMGTGLTHPGQYTWTATVYAVPVS